MIERTDDTRREGPAASSGEGPDPARSADGWFELVTERLSTLARLVRLVIGIRNDRAQLAIRRKVQLAIVALAAAFVGGAVLLNAVQRFMGGLSAGLALLFEGRTWLGDLAAGILMLALVGGGLALGLRRWDRTMLRKQQAKYAELQRTRKPTAPRGA